MIRRNCGSSPLPQLQSLADELRQYLVSSVASSGGHLCGRPRHRRADHRAALLLRHATRFARLGCRTPVLSAQGADRAPRPPRRRSAAAADFPASCSARKASYDSFGAGHSSTSISAALGIAIANDRQGDDQQVRGDHRRRRHDGWPRLRGARSRRRARRRPAGRAERQPHVDLAECRRDVPTTSRGCSSSRGYTACARAGDASWPGSAPAGDGGPRGTPAQGPGGARTTVRGTRLRSTSARSTAMTCPGCCACCDTMRRQQGPRLLHVVTRKGQGYAPAEADPVKYHGVTPFDPAVGIAAAAKPAADVHAGVRRLALRHSRAAIRGWSRSRRPCAKAPAWCEFAARFPDRYFDVGIAEQHSVDASRPASQAAGSSRSSRSIRRSCSAPTTSSSTTSRSRTCRSCLRSIARGLVGPDGATHNGSFDLSYLRCIPGLVVMTPATAPNCATCCTRGRSSAGPVAVRYPTATSARRRRRAACPADAAAGNGRAASPGHAVSRCWYSGRCCAVGAEGRGAARCNRGQHALRQAARSRTWCCAMARQPRPAGDARGERDRRRRRQRRR